MFSSGLKDLVDEIVLRSSLIALIVTAQTEHALHPTLTVVQGSHFFQSFCKIPTPDQVSSGKGKNINHCFSNKYYNLKCDVKKFTDLFSRLLRLNIFMVSLYRLKELRF